MSRKPVWDALFELAVVIAACLLVALVVYHFTH